MPNSREPNFKLLSCLPFTTTDKHLLRSFSKERKTDIYLIIIRI
ncbi:hypothetical protein ASZ90_011815 [hydrocarbon metagenome]|uniref:Uncharacterized protein n=1 Tax=hydrocarbon metagenome TaxID=938273 RepID=A0A0W8FC75_9ZZZZ